MDSDPGFYQSLEFIQNIIDRQASNSFKIKGWTITLVVVVLIFRTDEYQFLTAFIPLFGFWYLDGYYLRQEKKFRCLYDWIIEKQPADRVDRFTMDIERFEDEVDSIPALMLSRSLSQFYGMILVLLIMYSLIRFCPG